MQQKNAVFQAFLCV